MQHEAKDSRPSGGASGLTRAALLGLCGGLLLGGLFLLVQGLRARMAPMDCQDLSEVECGFIQQTAEEVGRMQTVAGAALLALGCAVVVLVRSRGRSATP
ncbi:MAG TPA: hypothetical protein VF794_32835 [Archangium sp.]|jgi:hypothetical protein|uniref:hypothetical protein n=1 Tax=Archangium sp. TaxID=1872627 RepID=UPI002EDB507C